MPDPLQVLIVEDEALIAMELEGSGRGRRARGRRLGHDAERSQGAHRKDQARRGLCRSPARRRTHGHGHRPLHQRQPQFGGGLHDRQSRLAPPMIFFGAVGGMSKSLHHERRCSAPFVTYTKASGSRRRCRSARPASPLRRPTRPPGRRRSADPSGSQKLRDKSPAPRTPHVALWTAMARGEKRPETGSPSRKVRNASCRWCSRPAGSPPCPERPCRSLSDRASTSPSAPPCSRH